ncbi:MAG: hypothetical protein WA988_17935 [Candidatus Nanopelagicales bacterium]
MVVVGIAYVMSSGEQRSTFCASATSVCEGGVVGDRAGGDGVREAVAVVDCAQRPPWRESNRRIQDVVYR